MRLSDMRKKGGQLVRTDITWLGLAQIVEYRHMTKTAGTEMIVLTSVLLSNLGIPRGVQKILPSDAFVEVEQYTVQNHDTDIYVACEAIFRIFENSAGFLHPIKTSDVNILEWAYKRIRPITSADIVFLHDEDNFAYARLQLVKAIIKLYDSRDLQPGSFRNDSVRLARGDWVLAYMALRHAQISITHVRMDIVHGFLSMLEGHMTDGAETQDVWEVIGYQSIVIRPFHFMWSMEYCSLSSAVPVPISLYKYLFNNIQTLIVSCQLIPNLLLETDTIIVAIQKLMHSPSHTTVSLCTCLENMSLVLNIYNTEMETDLSKHTKSMMKVREILHNLLNDISSPRSRTPSESDPSNKVFEETASAKDTSSDDDTMKRAPRRRKSKEMRDSECAIARLLVNDLLKHVNVRGDQLPERLQAVRIPHTDEEQVFSSSEDEDFDDI